MRPHIVEIRDFETKKCIFVDLEGPYHRKNERIGEHMYGTTLLIEGIPYHFEKYIPDKEELQRFKEENGGNPRFSKGGFFYRLVPFTKWMP
jgi:hypothetical protein